MRLNKKGVSPVIATVLLIGMVIVLGLIIFLWMRSLAQETITKFEGENIELACDKVEFTASKVGDQLTISNGNVPIFDFAIKISINGGYDTIDASELFGNDWPRTGLNMGKVFSSTSSQIQGKEITLIPILLGKSESGNQKKFTCNEKRHGQKVQ